MSFEEALEIFRGLAEFSDINGLPNAIYYDTSPEFIKVILEQGEWFDDGVTTNNESEWHSIRHAGLTINIPNDDE